MNLTVHHLAATRRVADLARALGRTADLNKAMGTEVRELAIGHLAALASTRHATAERLGASPSGFLERAAKAAKDTPLSVDAEAATVTISHPGMIRALRDVTITPSKKWLAIPVHALAYARRPAEVWEPWRLFVRGRSVFMRREGQEPLRLWALVRRVTQKRDRSLLPSDTELHKAAVAGAMNQVKAFLNR